MMKVLHPTKLVAAATLAFSVLASPLAHASKDVTFAVAIALETLDPYNTKPPARPTMKGCSSSTRT